MIISLEQEGIYTIPNFFTDEECENYKELVIRPPNGSCAFTNTGLFSNRKWIDPSLANTFYKKLCKYIEPSDLAIRANNIIMTGKYEPGQQFNMHTDTGLFYDRTSKEKSRWTLLIYLNADYEGGKTLFYDDNWQPTEDITPEKGKALLFDIDLWHRGDILKSGIKYWIGCEIIGKF